MQELIKLIVAVEWLYKEKGVRPNQDWIMQHTLKAKTHLKPDTRNKPPYDMIPKPTVFKRPTSDVTVKTREALQYETFNRECRVKRQYGYYDFSKAQMILFEEDGTPCLPEKCLKVRVEHQLRFFNMPPIRTDELHYLPLPEAIEPTKNKILELLPKNMHKENTSLVPASVERKVEDLTDEHRMELRVTYTIQPYPLLTMTTITTVTTCTRYTDEDPRMSIPASHGDIVPDVESWDELITELSVPIPRVRHHPYIGIGEPMNSGGVSTSGFRVREEPMQTREAYQETQRVGNFQRSGPLLGVRAEHIRKQGMSGSQHLNHMDVHIGVCTETFGEWGPGGVDCNTF